ncbi:pentapeptide repeat-containing protein [Catellatospora sp. NEAU-YM18]|nr:pentapeptide repeat-containing protein [Catellatospora tritici]
MILGIATAGAVIATSIDSGKQRELTEKGQITDRFTKANDQLGSDAIEGRLGGICALEQIMKDSADYEDPIIEILAAYVRNRTSRDTSPPASPSPKPDQSRLAKTPTDIQAALTVLIRRPDPENHRIINLARSYLDGVFLDDANLTRADLTGTHLDGASLTGADLRGANLTGANLAYAKLAGAKLHGAVLTGVDLTHVDLTGADLSQATFPGN